SGVMELARRILPHRQRRVRAWPDPPNKILDRASTPAASHHVMTRKPKIDGISQFHSSLTISPARAITAATPRMATGARKISLRSFPFIVGSSVVSEFVIERPQSFAQFEHGVALARQQRVDARACLARDLLEAAAVELVRHEDMALIGREVRD